MTKQIKTVTYQSIGAIHTEWDYRQAVLSLVDSAIYSINEALDCEQVEFDQGSIEDLVSDSLLHETVDQSEFAIYNHYHLPIIQFSNNDEYAIDNFGGDWAESAIKQGLSTLHSGIAFWALYEDVREVLQEVLENTDYISDEE